jgi:hypothetical protein
VRWSDDGSGRRLPQVLVNTVPATFTVEPYVTNGGISPHFGQSFDLCNDIHGLLICILPLALESPRRSAVVLDT